MSLADRPALAYVAVAAIAIVVVSPALSRAPRDSFPLSTFPMFAEGRKDANVTVEHAVAIDDDGGEQPVVPRIVGSDEVLQARATIARAIRRGPAATTELCQAIAKRASASKALSRATTIELRTTRLDAVAWFSADDDASRPAPLSVKRHAKCAVPGS